MAVAAKARDRAELRIRHLRRAAPAAAQVNAGNFAVVQAHWTRSFLDELADFPGRKDDQVDALSRAFGMLAAPAVPSAAERFRAMI